MKYPISLIIAAIAFMAIVGSTFAEDAKKTSPYAGDNMKTCKMCHAAQAKVFETSGMFKAWDSLDAEAKKKDECISCHVTGFGVEGGWISIDDTPALQGVQCEACHGPAAEHAKAPTKVKPAGKAAESCAKCHNEKFFGFKKDEWNLDEAMAKIKHWKDS